MVLIDFRTKLARLAAALADHAIPGASGAIVNGMDPLEQAARQFERKKIKFGG
jgi:hypothetical protein